MGMWRWRRGVLDPWVHTGTRVTWEQRTIACVLPETGTGREERRPLPIQVNGRGLDMAFWPPDCVGRAAGPTGLNGEDVDLPDEAECGPWERVFDGCSTPPPGPSATADPPPNWQFRNVGYSQNGSGACPSGYAGTSYWTDQWERREMNKDDGAGWFVVASRLQPGRPASGTAAIAWRAERVPVLRARSARRPGRRPTVRHRRGTTAAARR